MFNVDTQIKLLKINVTHKNLCKPGENIDIGMEAKLYVSTYKRSPKFKESTLKSFLDGVCRTLSGLVEHDTRKISISINKFFHTFSWCNKCKYHCNKK